MTDAVERISAATGVPYRYVEVTVAEKRRRLEEAGLPPATVALLEELFVERRRRPESEVRLATHRRFGVEPTTFEAFARRHAAAFLGAVPAA